MLPFLGLLAQNLSFLLHLHPPTRPVIFTSAVTSSSAHLTGALPHPAPLPSPHLSSLQPNLTPAISCLPGNRSSHYPPQSIQGLPQILQPKSQGPLKGLHLFPAYIIPPDSTSQTLRDPTSTVRKSPPCALGNGSLSNQPLHSPAPWAHLKGNLSIEPIILPG